MTSDRLKPGIHFYSIEIPPVGTHNTLPPFNSQMEKGMKLELNIIRIIGKGNGPKKYVLAVGLTETKQMALRPL